MVLKEAPKEEQAKEEPVDLCHLSNAGGSAESWEGYKKVTVNFDTGAAISAIPVAVAQAATKKTAASERCYRTASGEVIEDQGGALARSRAASPTCTGCWLPGAAVGKHNHVLLMGSKGYVMPKGGKIAKALEKAFREELKAGRGKDVLEMEERRNIYVFDLWVKARGTAESDQWSGRARAESDRWSGRARRAARGEPGRWPGRPEVKVEWKVWARVGPVDRPAPRGKEAVSREGRECLRHRRELKWRSTRQQATVLSEESKTGDSRANGRVEASVKKQSERCGHCCLTSGRE